MRFNKFIEKIRKIVFDVFFSTIFPDSRNQRFINKLTPEKFLALTQPSLRLPDSPNGQETVSVVNYKNALVRQTVWSLKFHNNQKIAKLFAEIIYDTIAEELANLKLSANFGNSILTPIPLSRKRLRERGYNQAELITRQMAKLDQNNFFEYQKHLLKKIKDTPPQSRSKNKTERLNNLRGCFKVVNPNLIKNRNIILLDDVVTTGATLAEASQTLRRAGARQIFCVTLAH